MDPQTDLPELVEDLEVNIDELTTALQPLLGASLSSTASSLPLLDKAKLYVLAAYSIESLLFSALQANGINAKEHAIFTELARLKGYFGKIKEIEERDMKPKTRIDIPAAQRFIKHGLAGNEKYDLERAEKMAKERARAALKANMLGKKAEEKSESGVVAKKRGVEEMTSEEGEVEDVESGAMGEGEERAIKRPHTSSSNATGSESVATSEKEAKSPRHKKRNKKKSKEKADARAQMEEGPSTPSDASRKKKKKNKKKKKAKQPSK